MARRFLTIFSVLYVLLLLYASLMPYDWTLDGATFHEHFAKAFSAWPFGHTAHTSKSDVLSNLLLYVPLGWLLATRWRVGRGRSWVAALVGAAFIASAVSLGVELLQAFSATRNSSAQDWLMNTIGGLAGALAGASCGRGICLRSLRGCRQRLFRRPMVVAAGVMLAVLAGDSIFPFLPTLDVGQVKRNVKAAYLAVHHGGFGLAEHPWHYWLLCRVAVYAVLTLALGASSLRPWPARWKRAALWAIAFAAILEFCKLFFVTRSANPANVLSSLSGAALGLCLGLCGEGRVRPRQAAWLAAVLLTGYMAYVEWTPFVFRFDAAFLQSRLPHGAQWLPLYGYAMGARAEDVRLFARTLILSGGIICALRLAGLLRGRGSQALAIAQSAIFAGVLGLLIRGVQLSVPSRVPALTTGLFAWALGGALGSWLIAATPTLLRRNGTASDAPS